MPRRARRIKTWLPRPLRRAFGPKRRYKKSFRRALALAIALVSAAAALSAWRGEDHARVAEERDRTAFDQRIGLEQQKAEIRVTQLLDITSTYARMKTAEFLADALWAQAMSLPRGSRDAARMKTESLANRRVQYDLLQSIPKDALTEDGTMTAETLDNGPQAIPDCPRSKTGPIESNKVGKFGVELQFATTQADLCPAEETAASIHGFSQANDQIGLAGIFILAAFLFTCAQVSSRPRAVVAGVGGGIATSLAAVALFILIEVS